MDSNGRSQKLIFSSPYIPRQEVTLMPDVMGARNGDDDGAEPLDLVTRKSPTQRGKVDVGTQTQQLSTNEDNQCRVDYQTEEQDNSVAVDLSIRGSPAPVTVETENENGRRRGRDEGVEEENRWTQEEMELMKEELEKCLAHMRRWARRGYRYSPTETIALLKAVYDTASAMLTPSKTLEDVAEFMSQKIFWDTGNPSLINIFERYVNESERRLTPRDGVSLQRKWRGMVTSIAMWENWFFEENDFEVIELNERSFLIRLAKACMTVQQPMPLKKIRAPVASSTSVLKNPFEDYNMLLKLPVFSQNTGHFN